MAFRAERYGTRADTAVFVACLLLSLTALALPEGLRAPVAGALRRTVLLPLLTLQHRAVESAEGRQRLTSLRAERDSLALASTFLPGLRSENDRLRGLLGLGARLGYGFVTAEVLHQSGLTDGLTLVLSAGREEGVAALSPVVTAEGLVGMVRAVDAHTSVALAWTHPDFRASAMVEGQRVFGIVAARRGEAAGELMELHGVPYRDLLNPGTRVVTSGLGGVFPRGIPLGTVHGTLSESAGWERTYLLRPAVHPAEASHVMVLAPARSSDTLTAAYAAPGAQPERAAPLPVPAAAPRRRLRR
jgi:rod shape-determining protein MreC